MPGDLLPRLRRWVSASLPSVGGRCAVCRGWCNDNLCARCDERYASARSRCEACGAPLAGESARCLPCRRHPPPWARVVAGVDYDYPWAALVAAFKFGQRVELAPVLCTPLQRRLVDAPRVVPLADLRVAPVPLSRERLRERGFNQAWEVARRLARAVDADAVPDALFRVRDTPHQPGLARTARAANLRGAFVVSPHRSAWVRGACVALVDDVLTSGATARAATLALRAAGAREVEIWVLARAASPTA